MVTQKTFASLPSAFEAADANYLGISPPVSCSRLVKGRTIKPQQKLKHDEKDNYQQKLFNYKFTALKSLIFLLVFYAIGPQNLASGSRGTRSPRCRAAGPLIRRSTRRSTTTLPPARPDGAHQPQVDRAPAGVRYYPNRYATRPAGGRTVSSYHVIGLMA